MLSFSNLRVKVTILVVTSAGPWGKNTHMRKLYSVHAMTVRSKLGKPKHSKKLKHYSPNCYIAWNNSNMRNDRTIVFILIFCSHVFHYLIILKSQTNKRHFSLFENQQLVTKTKPYCLQRHKDYRTLNLHGERKTVSCLA